MAIAFWSNMSILEGGYELAGHGKNVNVTVNVAPLDTTALSNTSGYKDLIGGLKTAKLDFEFMQNFADGSMDEILQGNFGTADVARSICSSATDGSVAFLMRGVTLTYEPISGGQVGSLGMGRVSSTLSTAPLARGLLIHPSNVTRSASAVGTGRQLGAVAAGKSLYAALHVLSQSGTTPTLDVIVQSDDNADFTSASNRITFSQVTGAAVPTSQWGSVAGAVTDDYWRVSYTLAGTSPVFAFAVTIGII